MEEDLLGDLIEYRKSRDKAVVTASRGLLQLYREVNPGMLKKRERVSTRLRYMLIEVLTQHTLGQRRFNGHCWRQTAITIWTYRWCSG